MLYAINMWTTIFKREGVQDAILLKRSCSIVSADSMRKKNDRDGASAGLLLHGGTVLTRALLSTNLRKRIYFTFCHLYFSTFDVEFTSK